MLPSNFGGTALGVDPNRCTMHQLKENEGTWYFPIEVANEQP